MYSGICDWADIVVRLTFVSMIMDESIIPFSMIGSLMSFHCLIQQKHCSEVNGLIMGEFIGPLFMVRILCQIFALCTQEFQIG